MPVSKFLEAISVSLCDKCDLAAILGRRSWAMWVGSKSAQKFYRREEGADFTAGVEAATAKERRWSDARKGSRGKECRNFLEAESNRKQSLLWIIQKEPSCQDLDFNPM